VNDLSLNSLIFFIIKIYRKRIIPSLAGKFTEVGIRLFYK